MTNGLLLFEDALQFIGAAVAFSIAYVSYRGVRETQSQSLLRLAAAFAFLGTGFILQGLSLFQGIVAVPAIATAVASLLIAGLFLETAGYFFLAFSHFLDVIVSKRMGVMLAFVPLIALNQSSITVILSSLSFYFILYGVVETMFSYFRTRNPNTLLIAVGLGMIAGGWWVSLVGANVVLLTVLQLIMKEVGLVTLFIPVLGFRLRKGEQFGSV